jgi:hypothetical protein
MTLLEDRVGLELRLRGIPAPEREHRFAALATGGTGTGCRERIARAGLQDWRLDFAWPDQRIALEVEGGVWSRGRHVRPAGFLGDVSKYNAVTMQGWRLLRVTGTREDAPVYRWLESELKGGAE